MIGPKTGYQEHAQRCQNCACAFVMFEYDSETRYYCNSDESPRPPCMSVAMDECPGLDDLDEFNEAIMAWDKWTQDRRVPSWGFCPHWVERK